MTYRGYHTLGWLPSDQYAQNQSDGTDRGRPNRAIMPLSIFFFNDTATTEIYTLSLHDALPISLGLGADDYLTKPFSPRTLLARIKALLRRAGMENTTPLAAGRVALDLREHTVSIGRADPVRLTKLELRLLQMLLANAGHTGSSDRLLVQVRGHRSGGDRQLLKQLVHRLRQKIEADPAAPALLRTAAAGYKLLVE